MLCSSLLPAGEAEHLQIASETVQSSLHPSCGIRQDQAPPLGYAAWAALGGSPAATNLGKLPSLERCCYRNRKWCACILGIEFRAVLTSFGDQTSHVHVPSLKLHSFHLCCAQFGWLWPYGVRWSPQDWSTWLFFGEWEPCWCFLSRKSFQTFSDTPSLLPSWLVPVLVAVHGVHTSTTAQRRIQHPKREREKGPHSSWVIFHKLQSTPWLCTFKRLLLTLQEAWALQREKPEPERKAKENPRFLCNPFATSARGRGDPLPRWILKGNYCMPAASSLGCLSDLYWTVVSPALPLSSTLKTSWVITRQRSY